jgi:hypothetical protein
MLAPIAARLAAIAALAALALATPGTAGAAAENPLILRAVVTQPGAIHLVVLGQPGSQVDLAELVGSTRRALPSVIVPPYGGTVLWGAAKWTCARSTRQFLASNAAGEFSLFSVRTPSCRKRLSVRVPSRVRRGSRVRVRVTDTFTLGVRRARLCSVPPAGRGRCRTVRVPGAGRPAQANFRATEPGRWRVVVTTPYQRTSRTIAVGVPVNARSKPLPRIFFTGDSMMQSLDNVITDRLSRRARTASDVFVGSGLSKPGFDWVAHTRRRVRRLRPAATVVFLGANDGFPLTTPSGAPANCCGEPWVAAYARRARRLIRAANGPTFLFTLPAPRDAERRVSFLAVNEALRRATAAERGSRLLDLVPVFSPGFAYRAFMMHRGRRVRVRESDGIHVSTFGALIESSILIRALEDARVVRARSAGRDR